MVAASSSFPPAIHADGSVTATVAGEPYRIGQAALLTLSAPRGVWATLDTGRYLLARCAEATPPGERTNWTIYLRVPLYFESHPMSEPDSPLESIRLLLTDCSTPGGAWLATRPPGTALHLLGPFGRSAVLAENVRSLLIAADAAHAPLFLPAAHTILDRGGRVALLLPPDAPTADLLPLCPLDMEIHVAQDSDQWQHIAADLLRWCDHLCAAGPLSPSRWLDAVQSARFALEPGFADLFVSAEIVCATGACYACSVPRRSGRSTRACVHGPVMDLAHLA